MKLCFHNILHIADNIENTGPCWATWQFPMEQVCEMLIPLARSRLHPYKNIVNNVHTWELFNHLRFYQAIYMKVFPPQQSKEYKSHLVFSQSEVEEEFYFLSKKYNLNQSELKKLKEYFFVYYDIANRKLKVKFCINIILF